MGRRPKEVDKKLFEALCALQCTEEEICAQLDVTDKTLVNWCKREYGKGFRETFAEKRLLGKVSLRRKQFRLAERNPAMSIFLGKNWLGQKDNQDVNVSMSTDATAAEMGEYFANRKQQQSDN